MTDFDQREDNRHCRDNERAPLGYELCGGIVDERAMLDHPHAEFDAAPDREAAIADDIARNVFGAALTSLKNRFALKPHG